MVKKANSVRFHHSSQLFEIRCEVFQLRMDQRLKTEGEIDRAIRYRPERPPVAQMILHPLVAEPLTTDLQTARRELDGNQFFTKHPQKLGPTPHPRTDLKNRRGRQMLPNSWIDTPLPLSLGSTPMVGPDISPVSSPVETIVPKLLIFLDRRHPSQAFSRSTADSFSENFQGPLGSD